MHHKPWSSLVSFAATKLLDADPRERHRRQLKDLAQRAKRAGVARDYCENEPTAREFVGGLVPSKTGAFKYVHGLFPSVAWIRRYNTRWLLGDVVAGITISLVVVPQAMAYALLAQLTPEYGLYTSFTGATLYWLFGTSKDIVIGTTAVGSLLVGTMVTKVDEKRPGVYSHEEVAKVLSVLAGGILLLLGLLRLGWIIDFIPYVPISAFVTSASITIMSTQIPVALGIPNINTREEPYKVLISTLQGLPRAKVDTSIGISCIAMLFAIRNACAKMEVRQPSRKRMWAFVSSLRLTFAMLLYTLISWLVNRGLPEGTSRFRIVGKIDHGFKHAGVPRLDPDLIGIVAPQTPSIVLILIIEHIAIAKSFGRMFGYNVITSQEILASGVANLSSSFVGGYVCTGSFGASAVLSKAGVRTPLAGLFSAFILILALYFLTPVFYYIPNAALAGLIIHAVSNLMTPPRSLYRYWQLSPLELGIWVVGVLVALFSTLETSIYCTVTLSFVILLVRIARTKGRILGRVRIQLVYENDENEPGSEKSNSPGQKNDVKVESRDTFLPMDRRDASNPHIEVASPHPGVFVYRFSGGLNYTNQALHTETLHTYIMQHTRRTQADDGILAADRLWCDPGPCVAPSATISTLSVLRAVVLDCSAVNNVDITSVQGLVDLRSTLDRYAAPVVVEWHFASLQNRWTRRALAVAGFGFPAANDADQLGNWRPVWTVATGLAGATDDEHRDARFEKTTDEENSATPDAVSDEYDKKSEVISLRPDGKAPEESSVATAVAGDVSPSGTRGLEPLYSVDRPFFHVDLLDAVDAAVRDAMKKDEGLML